MTLFRYRPTDMTLASTVRQLKDGSFLELRRGEKTHFAPEERRTWASLEDWVLSLPAGAEIAADEEGGPKEARVPKATAKVAGNPDMERILPVCRRRNGLNPVSNMRRVPSRDEQVAKLTAEMKRRLPQMAQVGLRYRVGSPQHKSHLEWFEQSKKQFEDRLAKLAASPPFEESFHPVGNGLTRILFRAEDGTLNRLYLDPKRGLFGRGDTEATFRVGKSLAEIGLADAELWVNRHPEYTHTWTPVPKA